MADNKDFDWFSFNPKKFYFGVQEMEDHIVGRYIKLLCLQWFKGSISSDFPGMSDILTVTGEILSVDPPGNDPRGGSRPLEGGLNSSGPSVIKIRLDTKTLWEALQPKFSLVGVGRYANDYLEQERENTQQRIERHQISVAAGREGGKKSAFLRAQKPKPPSNHASTPPSTTLVTLPTGEVQPVVLVPSQPITLHYIDNTLSQKKLKKEEGEENTPSPDADKLSERMDEVVRHHWDFMRLAGDLAKRPENFQKFVVEFWKKDVMARGLNGNAKTLRKSFVDLYTTRLDAIEKAFLRQERDLNWFNHELLKVVPQQELQNPVVKKFCEYYARELETGGYLFQNSPNFSVENTLRDWFASERTKKGSVSLKKKSSQTLFDTPNSSSNAPAVPTPAQKERDAEIEAYLNERFKDFLKTGKLNKIDGFYYQYLLEVFPNKLPTHEVVKEVVMPVVYAQRKDFLLTAKGSTEEETRRIDELKAQYVADDVQDMEECLKLTRLAYCEAAKPFFLKLKNFGDQKIF